MALDGNADFGQSLDELDRPLASRRRLELYAPGASLLQKPGGILDRPFDRRPIGAKRHVSDHEGLLGATDHRCRVRDCLVHRHRNRAVVAELIVACRVSDQYHVDTPTLDESGERRIVGCQHRQRDPLLVARVNRADGRPGHGYRRLAPAKSLPGGPRAGTSAPCRPESPSSRRIGCECLLRRAE